MATLHRVGIAGTGAYVPKRVVPNSYFEEIVDTSNEWIVQRTGIEERRFVEEGETTSSMSIEAAKKALESANMKAEDLDLIVVGTLTPDHLLPACAARVQKGLGATNAGAFDCNAACTGFMTAMSIGESFVRAGRAKRVLVIGAEVLSSFINFEDRASCILFGDGAGAAILAPHEEVGGPEILETHLGADGEGYEFIHMQGGGSVMPPTPESVAEKMHYIMVKGRDVYRFAVTTMASLINQMLEGHEREELGLIVPHQVNLRIIESALDKLELPIEKCMVNINKYGNTSAATIPIALDEANREGRLEKGKLVLMAAFGAGLTWGSVKVRW